MATSKLHRGGFIIYRGPSMLDSKPIVVVALVSKGGANSANRKTGDIVQTYILPDNGIKPSINVKTGADVSVCGDCKHRGTTCYVVLAQGPTVVTKQIAKGAYPVADPMHASETWAGLMVRLGTYGDPAAVPVSVWHSLLTHSAKHAGYTHQWRNESLHGTQLEALRGIVMASCDTPEERDEAQAMGWRTFTVRLESDPLAKRESVCPASAEAGQKVTCSQCAMCDGAGTGRKGSIAIIAHGRTGNGNAYKAFRSASSIHNTI